ncbi:tetratricopeptide repeat protein [Candidatus Gracilibacteria bacterium]|nr:tetratricopeptide repeat protein [Candidatus Gracilibacteria bacterium]
MIAQTVLGQIAYLVGRYADAHHYSQTSLALERELGNYWGTVFTLITLGRIAYAQGGYADARRWFQEGLAIREALADARGIGLCLNYLGDVASAQANYDEAQRCYQRSSALFSEIGNRAGAATALAKLGYNELKRPDTRAARYAFQQALSIAWSIRALPQVLDALTGLAGVLAPTQPQQAGMLLELVLRQHTAVQETHTRARALYAELVPQLEAGATPPLSPAAPTLDLTMTVVAMLQQDETMH